MHSLDRLSQHRLPLVLEDQYQARMLQYGYFKLKAGLIYTFTNKVCLRVV